MSLVHSSSGHGSSSDSLASVLGSVRFLSSSLAQRLNPSSSSPATSILYTSGLELRVVTS